MLKALRKKFGPKKQVGKHDLLPKKDAQKPTMVSMRARVFKGSVECASALTQITSDMKLAASVSLIVTCEDDLVRSGCILTKIRHHKGSNICILTKDRNGNELWFTTTKALRDYYLKENLHEGKDVLLMKELIVSFPTS